MEMKWLWNLCTLLVLASNFEVRGQTAEEAPDPGKEEGFKDLITENQLDESASFRCGIFFAGDKINDKPREVVFIIPKRFPTDCTNVKQDEIKEFCLKLFKRITTVLGWETTSKKRGAPFKIGDDVCDGSLKRTGIKKPPPTPRFPDGVQVGFYYNFCTDIKWYDTELRVPRNLCCKEDPTNSEVWVFNKCPKDE